MSSTAKKGIRDFTLSTLHSFGMVTTRSTSMSREGALQRVINTVLNGESNTKYRLIFDANDIQMTIDFMLLGEDDFGAMEGLHQKNLVCLKERSW